MKILFVVPYTPNLVRTRSYNLIKALHARKHIITLATLWEDQADLTDLQFIQPYCNRIITQPMPRWRSLWNSLLALPTPSPLQYSYSWQPALAQELCRLVTNPAEKFDAIHVEHLRGARYGVALQDCLKKQGRFIPIIWDSVDCISLLFRYAAQNSGSLFTWSITRLESKRNQRWEARLIRLFDHTVITSPKDRDAILALQPPGPAEKVTTISNGVDLAYFQPDDARTRRHDTLVLSGKMSYHANIAMAQALVTEIMPLLWAQKPEIKLQIVGKDPPAFVQAYANDPRIQVTGMVPEVRTYLQHATVAVAPLRYAVGVQNKVLEAMACGTPVVTTPHVMTSLDAIPGQDLMVGDDAPAFARAVLELLGNPQRRIEMGRSARKYVEKNHDWNLIAERLERIYQASRSKTTPIKAV